jgi:hypothetical protein
MLARRSFARRHRHLWRYRLGRIRLLQPFDVWPPGIVVTDGVVVHQKDVLGHFELPIPRRLRSKHYCLAPLRAFNPFLHTRSRKHREIGKCSIGDAETALHLAVAGL